MSNSIAEGKLAKLIQFICLIEDEVENNRLRLANNQNFDPFQNFRDLDRSGKGYLNEIDISDLLRSFKLNVNDRDLDPLLATYKDGLRKITFQDFLRHISPSDPKLKNVFLNRFGVRTGSKVKLDDTHRVIANIYKREADYNREIENLRHSLTNEPKYEEAVYSLADPTTGSLSAQSIAKFMNKHHYSFPSSDFDGLVRRLDSSNRGQLTLHEFNSFIYPGEFQSNSNYSISHGGNYRYDVQGSLFDSMSTPGRDVGGFNPHNIRVNETYIPPSTTVGAYHSLRHSPPRAAPDVIAERIISGVDYRPSHPISVIEERKPAIEVRRVSIDPITRSPPRAYIQESYYNPKIAAIRDHPLYHQAPAPSHVVTHVEHVRREVPERIVANLPAPTRLISTSPISTHKVTTVENIRREIPERLVSTHVSTHVTPSRHVTKEYLRPSYTSAGGYTLSATRPSVDTKSVNVGGSALNSYANPRTLLGRGNPYSKTTTEEKVSVSPIKRTTNIDTTVSRNYQYITPNIPPRYQLSSLQQSRNVNITSDKAPVARENIEQRNSTQGSQAAETRIVTEENVTAQPSTTIQATRPEVETNVTNVASVASVGGAGRNYSYITPNIPPKYQSSIGQNAGLTSKYQSSSYSRTDALSSQRPAGTSYLDRNSKATELLAQREGLRTSNAGLRSDIKQEIASKDVTQEIGARASGVATQEVKYSTVLESYKTDAAQRTSSIRPGYGEERIGYGVSRPVHDIPVKTEGDQVTAASSYKFANSKYEQLWGPEPANE